jgi:hypothetical protein
VDTSISAPRRLAPFVAMPAQPHLLLGVALVFLTLGAGLGYGVGVAKAPRPARPSHAT